MTCSGAWGGLAGEGPQHLPHLEGVRRRLQPLAADVPHRQRDATVGQREGVEEVPARLRLRGGRRIERGDGQAGEGILGHLPGERALEGLGDILLTDVSGLEPLFRLLPLLA